MWVLCQWEQLTLPTFCAIRSQAAVSMLALHHLDFLQGLVFFPWQASDGGEETTAEDAVSCFFEIDFHLPAMTPADD